jgi:hypothetical protein
MTPDDAHAVIGQTTPKQKPKPQPPPDPRALIG